jgi:hypothetical protein
VSESGAFLKGDYSLCNRILARYRKGKKKNLKEFVSVLEGGVSPYDDEV